MLSLHFHLYLVYSLFYRKKRKMLFSKKNCSDCGSNYDIVDATCPVCGHRDENFETLGIPKNVTWLPWPKQIIIFAIGLIGLNLMSIIGELIFMHFIDPNSVTYLTVINVFRYAICALAICLVIFKDFKKFKDAFIKWQPYLIGVGFAAAILISQVIINLFIQSLHPTTTSDNQQAVVSVITAYPVLSIFLLGIVGPLVEEFTYRIGLFTFLRRVNVFLAYIVTSLVFGLIHFNFFATGDALINELLNLPSYVISGFLLTLAYDKFGFACSSVAHIVNNLFSIVVSMIPFFAMR